MRILIAADIFPPESGGPATYSVVFANKLAGLGHEVKIVSLNKYSDKNVVICPVFAVGSSWKLARYFQYLFLIFRESKKVDLMYAMGPVNAGLPALLASILTGKKLAVKVVGDYAWERWQSNGGNGKKEFVSPENFFSQRTNFKIKLLKWVERIVVKKADAVIVPSEYLKKIVAAWGAKDEKIKVVYNAIEVGDIVGFPHDGEKWIVTAARLLPWKGVDGIIQAVDDLKKTNSEMRLKIIGAGPEEDRLKKIVADSGLQNFVEFLGELTRDKTQAYIKSADVLVLNSGYEGLSHVILEALALGAPVIASKIGGNIELLHNERLFTYDDMGEIKQKIIAIISKESQAGESCKIPVEKLTLGNMINETLLVFRGLCAK